MITSSIISIKLSGFGFQKFLEKFGVPSVFFLAFVYLRWPTKRVKTKHMIVVVNLLSQNFNRKRGYIEYSSSSST